MASTSWQELLDQNVKWWHGEVVDGMSTVGGYQGGIDDPQIILAENPNADLLTELNEYVITIDSQDGTSTLVGDPFPSPGIQRPYVHFFASPELGQKLMAMYQDSKDIVIDIIDIQNRTLTSNTAAKDEGPSTLFTIRKNFGKIETNLIHLRYPVKYQNIAEFESEILRDVFNFDEPLLYVRVGAIGVGNSRNEKYVIEIPAPYEQTQLLDNMGNLLAMVLRAFRPIPPSDIQNLIAAISENPDSDAVELQLERMGASHDLSVAIRHDPGMRARFLERLYKVI